MLPALLMAAAAVKDVPQWLSSDFLSSSSFTLPHGFFFYAFIVFTVAVYAFESYLDWRQHRCYAVTAKPSELTWVSDADFAAAQSYGLDKSRYNAVKSAFDTAKLLLFLLAAFYPRLWAYSGDLLSSVGLQPASHPLLHSCAFFALEQLTDTLLSLPFAYYKTFGLEAAHGFNQSTRALFFSDQLKTLALTVVIGVPLLALILVLIEKGGAHFYLYVWALVFAVQLLALTVYPILIQPLFNKVEPLEQGPLRLAIEALAQRVQFPLRRLYRIDGSKRSSHSNAYLVSSMAVHPSIAVLQFSGLTYGFFTNKRIVIFDTLINQSSLEEVVAVLAHEIGHWRLSHTVQNLVLAQVQILLLFFMFGQVLNQPRIYRDFGFTQSSTYIGLLIFQFLYSPVAHVAAFLMNVVSRRFEFEADAYAVKLGYGKELQSGLIGLNKNNKGAPINDPLWSAYHHTHPPLLERLRAIEAKKKE